MARELFEIKKNNDITSYFTDYVKTTVVQALMDKLGYTREEAEERTKEYLNDLETFSNMIPRDYEIEVELKHL